MVAHQRIVMCTKQEINVLDSLWRLDDLVNITGTVVLQAFVQTEDVGAHCLSATYGKRQIFHTVKLGYLWHFHWKGIEISSHVRWKWEYYAYSPASNMCAGVFGTISMGKGTKGYEAECNLFLISIKESDILTCTEVFGQLVLMNMIVNISWIIHHPWKLQW